jgi:hypothetical protein
MSDHEVSLSDLTENIQIVIEEETPIDVIPEQQPEPVAEQEPEPVAEQEPEPVAEQEPEPVAEQEPEPVAEQEPEPVAEQEPEPVAEQEPEPIAEQEPEPVAEQEPEPIAEQEPEPVAEQEPEPVAEQEPEPVAEQEPEPVAEQEPEPVAEQEPEPVAEQEPEPVPKIVFIVPYRDREQQYLFFSKQMSFVLEDLPASDYKIFYLHQKDQRAFNRGALKNIGFLHVKTTYPNDYHNITLVFNDIDTMPYTKNFLNYQTSFGTVKHFYGFENTLGGIVSITGRDFEKVSGFPNLWTWGYEDNMLQKRVLTNGLVIDRSSFYPLMDKNIFQMKDSLERLVNRGEFDRYASNTQEGFHSISDLSYEVDPVRGFIHITSFNTGTEENKQQTMTYDIRNGNVPFSLPIPVVKPVSTKRRPTMFMRL